MKTNYETHISKGEKLKCEICGKEIKKDEKYYIDTVVRAFRVEKGYVVCKKCK
jgi:hypothetical protein